MTLSYNPPIINDTYIYIKQGYILITLMYSVLNLEERFLVHLNRSFVAEKSPIPLTADDVKCNELVKSNELLSLFPPK